LPSESILDDDGDELGAALSAPEPVAAGEAASSSLEAVPAGPFELVTPPEEAGTRLDAFLAKSLPKFSRMQLRRVINSGGVRVDGLGCKVAYRLEPGQKITVSLPLMPPAGPNPEDIPLDILFEDDAMIVVNKPPGMVVHPSRGHWSGTLSSALAWRFKTLSQAGGEHRPGIVHRLDRDTSGVLVVAKSDPSHFALAEQFAQRTTEKEYLTITAIAPDRDRDVIRQPIGAHPYQREKMAIRSGHPTSREAETFYEVLERFGQFALVRVTPKTGRTHQIRVHLAHIGCPVLCDRLYGGRADVTLRGLLGEKHPETVVLSRQALHAHRIRIKHPDTQAPLEFVAPLPEDLQQVIDLLRTRSSKR
jgi:23S rRNA pseudouridine1911/1915/1917 synthase